MDLQIMVSAFCGLFAGAGGMFLLQAGWRRKELERLAGLAEDLLTEREVRAEAPGEETLYAKVEHQLIRVQEMLQGRKDAAERSRDEIQKLISEIAHQMRTPLTNIETWLGLLEEDLERVEAGESLDSEKAMQYVKALGESERKLYFLTESFIRMSRLEHHILQIKKEENEILKTVRNTLGQIQSRAEEKKIRFEITFPQEAFCPHDSNWLGEAIYNILDNAVKYSEPGGKIEVSVLRSEMYLKIRVRDYGIGIDAGEENRIFRRFYRGKRVTTQEGFGIGLYLAREIVNRHGGFLTVKRMNPGLLMECSLPFFQDC